MFLFNTLKYLHYCDPDPRTKIQRPQAGIKGLGFFNAYNFELFKYFYIIIVSKEL